MIFTDVDPWRGIACPVVGMIHLAPLPGSPRSELSLAEITSRALADADTLAECGADGLMLENFGDTPFFPSRVPPITIACMTSVAAAVKRHVSLPLGINVLRNDGLAALSIAVGVGAQFVRINVLCGARVADQGLLEGCAHDVLRLRGALRASEIQVLADVNVKHSAPLAARELSDEVQDLVKRGMADGVIVTGVATGAPARRVDIEEAKQAAGPARVWVGSGVTASTLPELTKLAGGLIVGSALKLDNDPTRTIDKGLARAFFAAR